MVSAPRVTPELAELHATSSDHQARTRSRRCSARSTLETYAFARLFVEQRERAPRWDRARLISDRTETWLWTKLTVESIASDPLVFCREVARHRSERQPAFITDLRLRPEVDYLRPRTDAASGWA